MSILRHLLAAVLGALLLLQPIGATSPRCTVVGLATGRGVCCCAGERPETSCCAEERPASDPGVPAVAAERCACRIDLPPPASSLPRDAGARSDRGSASELERWIGAGAVAVLATSTLPGDPVPRPPGRASPPSALGLRARGLMAVTCVVRC